MPEESRVLDAEATGGVVGRDIEERRALAPPLPLDRQNMREAEVVTPPRREVNGHGGLRAAGFRLPQRGTRVGALTDFGGLVEEAEVWGAECLASAPVDKDLRLLVGAACPASVTVCEDCIISPGVVGTLSPSDSDSVGPVGLYGTLSPSDSDSVGPVGHDGTLSSADLAGILFPAVSAGIPFPVGPVGPIGPVVPYGTLSPSDSDYVGPVSPDGTLSSSDLAGILFPAIPAGIPFLAGHIGPVGPFGTLFPSDSDSVGPVGPNVTWLVPVVWWLVPVVWTGFPEGRDPVITQSPAEVLVGDYRDAADMDVTVDSYQDVPDVVEDPAVVAMVGLDAMRSILRWIVKESVRIFAMSLKQSTVCLFIMVVIYMIRMSRIGKILVTSRMRNMWICITLMPQKEWN